MESIDPFERPPADFGPETPDTAALDLDEQVKAAREETLRVMAEMDNQRKRLQRDVDAARKYGTEKLLADLLPVCDGLEAGLRAEGDPAKLREGMELTLRMLLKSAAAHGLQVIDPAGERFDPTVHQAVSMVDSPKHPPGMVVNVFQKGYGLNDRLLRPAMVAVSRDPAA